MADVRFGVFQLDVSSGELFKAGVRVTLAAQPLQILIALLDRPGALVTRDELRQRLWPSDTFVDFEHGLNAAVKRLRDALGEDAASPRFIETLPRRGYRFIAPVITSAPPLPAALQTETPAVMGEPRHARPVRIGVNAWTLGSAAGVLVLAAVSALFLTRARGVNGHAPRLVPLTSLAGDEMRPALSPDGTQVAFFWGRATQ